LPQPDGPTTSKSVAPGALDGGTEQPGQLVDLRTAPEEHLVLVGGEWA
jgi:hypothetical protein